MILPVWYAKCAENQMTLCKHTRMFANKLSLPSDTLNAPKLEISSEPILAYVLIYKGELRRNTRGTPEFYKRTSP